MEGLDEQQSRFVEIGKELGELLVVKNRAYGRSFERGGEILKILYPDGISPEQMPDALGMIRIVDKLFRIATDRDALGESPWRDVAGYAILGAERVERLRNIQPAGPVLTLPVKVDMTIKFDPPKLNWHEDTRDPGPVPTICPACLHDHGRAQEERGGCLRQLAPDRQCGCTGSGPVAPPKTESGCDTCQITGFRGVCPSCGLNVQEIPGTEPRIIKPIAEHVISAQEIPVCQPYTSAGTNAP